MQSIHDAARRLMIAGVVVDMPSGVKRVTDFAQENGIEIDSEGFVSDNDYDEIIAELRG